MLILQTHTPIASRSKPIQDCWGMAKVHVAICSVIYTAPLAVQNVSSSMFCTCMELTYPLVHVRSFSFIFYLLFLPLEKTYAVKESIPHYH
jgi:hypothetical protein